MAGGEASMHADGGQRGPGIPGAPDEEISRGAFMEFCCDGFAGRAVAADDAERERLTHGSRILGMGSVQAELAGLARYGLSPMRRTSAWNRGSDLSGSRSG